MDTRWTKLCVLLVLCAELCCRLADSASLSGSLSPDPAIKGPSSQHTIKCTFSLDNGDNFQGLKLYLGSSEQPNLVAVILSGGGNLDWAGQNVPANLRQRGFLQGSKDDGHLSLVLNDTQCSDKDRSYTCELEYFNVEYKIDTATIPVSVQAAPLAPSEMVRTPDADNVREFTEMTFECSGNVGRPAGTFQWFSFVGSGTGSGQEVTDQASQENEVVASDGCTFTRASRLTLNLTRTEASERLVVRCRVEQVLGNSDVTACTDADTDFCRMSSAISVQYPVSVSVTSDTVTREEGDDVDITCSTQSNPQPFSVEWQKEGENTTVSGNDLRLRDLTLNDAGTYVCTAYNNVTGVVHNDSIAVSLRVNERTTMPPTTAPSSTSTTPKGDGGNEPNKAGSDDTTIIIVVVVVVVVVVIVVVVAVVIFLRRRKKGKAVEEPPEKPFNNHAAINTVATRPDLVSNDYNNPSPMKTEDGLAYAELQFDNKPRSRRPLAIDDSHKDYADVSMPQV